MRMRLWHEALLPYLPRAQLLGQHRECCALRGLAWGRRHAVVDYVFTHSRERLAVYHARVMREMQRRGYRVEDCWRAPGYRGQRCAPFVPDREKMTRLENRYPVYAEHDTAYFRACVENLRRKGAAILSEGVKQMDVSRRETIPEQYVWRMTDIYADDAQWEQDFARVQQMTEEMAAFSGHMQEDGQLEAALLLYEQLNRTLEQVYMYAHMQQDLDNASAKYQSMNDRAQSLLFGMQEALAFFLPELTAMDPQTLRSRVAADPRLASFDHMIDDIIRSRKYVLPQREEQLLAMASPALESMDAAFSMLDSVDLKRGEIQDENGETVTLTNGLFGKFRDSRDRRVRRDAFAALHGAYAGMGNTIAALYIGQVRADVFAAKARGYESALQAKLHADNLPREVYTGLIDAVHEALPELYRYLEVRRRVMGVDKLHIYDVYVPLVDVPDKTYSFEEACDTVLQQLSPLGGEYQEDLRRLLAGGWVDVFETPGKTTGAYATSVYGVHPFMLLNFTGRLEDVFTLAHEAGHCLHSLYSDQQPYMKKDYPIFLAEIASTVNENILIRGLLEECRDERQRAFLINRFVEEFRGTVFRQTMFAEFELKVHEMAERGEPLTAEILCRVYHELLALYFGPDVEIDPYMDWEWARIPHFYSAFYVFKYATGFSAAVALCREILEQGDAQKYLAFLHAGGSDYPADTLRRAGVDMSTPEPVSAALEEFGRMTRELESLLK